MTHRTLNLLAWRTIQARKKIIHDGFCTIFFMGAVALIIALGVCLMQTYCLYIQHQINTIQKILHNNLQAEQKAMQAKQIFLQRQQNVEQEKTNQLLWQTLLDHLNYLYQEPKENILLNKIVWHESYWLIEGFTEKNESLMLYQKHLSMDHFVLDINAWQPSYANDKQSNFQLSGQI